MCWKEYIKFEEKNNAKVVSNGANELNESFVLNDVASVDNLH